MSAKTVKVAHHLHTWQTPATQTASPAWRITIRHATHGTYWCLWQGSTLMAMRQASVAVCHAMAKHGLRK